MQDQVYHHKLALHRIQAGILDPTKDQLEPQMVKLEPLNIFEQFPP